MWRSYLDGKKLRAVGGNGDGLNVVIKRGGRFRANTVEKTGHNATAFGQMICLPTCIRSVRISVES